MNQRTNVNVHALAFIWLTMLMPVAMANEYHVSVKGSDDNDGSATAPFKTIGAAAGIAQPGDVITVHAGTYRERITPPRGGESDAKRIVYQAAPGEEVVVKGSEVIKGWEKYQADVWKVAIPNSFFGNYNPYQDLINGDWFTDKGRPHHTGDVYLNGVSLFEVAKLEAVVNPKPYPDARDQEASLSTWYCESDGNSTVLYANFRGKDPNQEVVEINVRDSCFYPDTPGRNYITIRGLRMCQAATQWAAPTAEQIGLIGTHWSKGWIIENNVISDSRCSGITLGKDRETGHNVWSNNPEKDGATHYNEVIVRALKAGWSRENIGSHIVRNNVIFNCEQTGICGSLGPAFSQITNNHIYDIWKKRQFTGAEMGGIKLHAPIDVLIKNNRIHNTGRGLWMDWMAQGTRITGNLLYDNTTDDLFVEVNHGPFMVDNNVFLSPFSLRDWSEGGAYAHNLFGGRTVSRPELRRSTPYQQAHSTALSGSSNTEGGDSRFYNNIFLPLAKPASDAHSWDKNNPQRATGFGLAAYDVRKFPVYAAGNVYVNQARPYGKETEPTQITDDKSNIALAESDAGQRVFLNVVIGQGVEKARTQQVTSKLLGKARVSQLGYENADGSPITIDYDFFGKPRNKNTPTAGPFEGLRPGGHVVELDVGPR